MSQDELEDILVSHHGHEGSMDSDWNPSVIFGKPLKDVFAKKSVEVCQVCESKGQWQHPHNGDWVNCSCQRKEKPEEKMPEKIVAASQPAITPAGPMSKYKRHDNRSVLEIILDVHTTNTGSYERSDEDQTKDQEYLAKRLKDWYPQWDLSKSQAGFLRFDEAVRNLVKVVLEEEEKQ